MANFTLTHYADHVDGLSHDAINRYLRKADLDSSVVWQRVEGEIKRSGLGYILFDDTVLDKRYSREIEMARRQYSGNEGGIVRGIGVVNCLYLNPETNEFWVIDYRIFDPDTDKKTKHDHVHDMLKAVMEAKKLPFRAVLMDSWYATMELMLTIEEAKKIYYCPLKPNRLVDDSAGTQKYKPIEQLAWSDAEQKQGKTVKVRGFPKDHKLKLFRVAVSTDRTDFIATNDPDADSTDKVKAESACRWRIEQFHREIKQLTGIERCQCRKAEIQRSHIACAMIVWTELKAIAYKTGITVYQLKQSLYSNLLKKLLAGNNICFDIA